MRGRLAEKLLLHGCASVFVLTSLFLSFTPPPPSPRPSRRHIIVPNFTHYSTHLFFHLLLRFSYPLLLSLSYTPASFSFSFSPTSLFFFSFLPTSLSYPPLSFSLFPTRPLLSRSPSHLPFVSQKRQLQAAKRNRRSRPARTGEAAEGRLSEGRPAPPRQERAKPKSR